MIKLAPDMCLQEQSFIFLKQDATHEEVASAGVMALIKV
jgi:hypothetical protein